MLFASHKIFHAFKQGPQYFVTYPVFEQICVRMRLFNRKIKGVERRMAKIGDLFAQAYFTSIPIV